MKQWTSPGDIYHPNHTNNYKNVYTGLIIVSPKLSYSVTGSDPVFRCSCVNWYSWWYLLGQRRAVHHITLFMWHYKYDCDKNEYRVINYHILYGVFPMDMMSHAILFIFFWSLNVLNTTMSRNEVVVTISLIPATTYLYNPTQCRHNIMMTIHSIHYRGIIYCNWLWCCDPPAASTIHLIIVFDSFYSIISNLLLPPFPITRPRIHTSTWPKGWNTVLN